MKITKIVSFGHKHGNIPNGVVIDLRILPLDNPFYQPSLRPLTGKDEAVRKFVQHSSSYDFTYQTILRRVLSANAETVYVGCTGGKHRSVVVAEQLAQDLHIEAEHRDIHHG